MAVFSTTYDGGDFCAGLVFGMNGADMLTKIAKAAFWVEVQQHLHKTTFNGVRKTPWNARAMPG